MKGGVVFQGNQVTNQSWEAAIFQDLGSSPATMEASRVADMWGCCPGHGIMQADAPQAYIQTELLGTETWVCLPPEARPKSWKGKYRFPVVPLKKALYGHPDAGTYFGRSIVMEEFEKEAGSLCRLNGRAVISTRD